MFTLLAMAFCSINLRWNVFYIDELRALHRDHFLSWYVRGNVLRFMISLITGLLVTLFTPVTFADWNHWKFFMWAGFLTLFINFVLSSMGSNYDAESLQKKGEPDPKITPPWLNFFCVISVAGLITLSTWGIVECLL